jgi:hypothetical protein
MSWKCDNCNHYTADGQKHDCINDRFSIAQEQISSAIEILKQIKYCCPLCEPCCGCVVHDALKALGVEKGIKDETLSVK